MFQKLFSTGAVKDQTLAEVPVDLAALYACSIVSNLILADSCPSYSIVKVTSNLKVEPANGKAFLGVVPSQNKTVYAVQEQRRTDVVGLDARTQTIVQNAEKFIVASLISGIISPEAGLDFANCSLVDTIDGSWITRQTLNPNNLYFYTDSLQLRQVLVKAAVETRGQKLRVDWKKIIEELTYVMENLHQKILTLYPEELSKSRRDNRHLFSVCDKPGVVANLEIVKRERSAEVEVLSESLSSLSLASSRPASSSRAPYSIGDQFKTVTQMIDRQIRAFQILLDQEKILNILATNSKVAKSTEDRNIEELLAEYSQDPSLKVQLPSGSEQDFILFCVEHEIQLGGLDPLVFAYRKGRKISGADPLVYAIDNDIRIEKRLPVVWISAKAKGIFPIEIQGKNAMAWLAENRPHCNIEGMDIVSFAQARGVKLGSSVGANSSAIEWLAAHTTIVRWQGKGKYEWIIDKWLKDPSIRIEGMSPIIWCINNNKHIMGQPAYQWLRHQAEDSPVFLHLIRANILNPDAERLFFHERIVAETDGRVDLSSSVSSNSSSKSTYTLVSQDSIVWLVKSLPVVSAEFICTQLQMELRKINAFATHVEWLRDNRVFDLIGYLRANNLNFHLDSKPYSQWLEEQADRITLTKEDKEALDYEANIKLKLQHFGNEESPGVYAGCGEDFFLSLATLNIFEEELLQSLTLNVNNSKEGVKIPPPTEQAKQDPLFVFAPYLIFSAYGFNVNGLNIGMQSPMHVCIKHKFLLQLLLDRYGASPNVQNAHGDTPAHLAASVGSIEILQYLRLKGADFTILNKKGMSVIDAALQDHIPGDKGGRDRLEIIKYLVSLNLKSEEFKTGIQLPWFNKKNCRDELIVRNRQGKTLLEVAEAKRLFDVVEFARKIMADRVNAELLSFLRMLYQPAALDSPTATIPLIITHPIEASKLAKACATVLNNYLPYLMGSVFNRGVQAFNIIRWHIQDFPDGKVIDKETEQSIIGPIAEAGAAVHQVFQIIERHGVVEQVPHNFKFDVMSSLSFSSSDRKAEWVRRRAMLADLDDDDDLEFGVAPISTSSSSSSRSSEDLRIYNTAIVSQEGAQVLLLIPDEVIRRLRGCVHEFFRLVIVRFQDNENDKNPDSEVNILDTLFRGKIGVAGARDIYKGMDKYIHNLFRGFIEQLQKDLKADPKMDESKYETVKSYRMLLRIQELLTGVQVQWGENQGWCKKLADERVANQDRPGYIEMLSSGFRQMIGMGGAQANTK